MRIVVFGDTHLPRGGRGLPPLLLDALATADLAVHTGDVTGAAVLAELHRLVPIHAVAGNMDDAELRQGLPGTAVVEAGETRIGVVHDPGPRHGRAGRLVSRFPGCAAVAYGHTHVPQVERRQGVWILNPGSPTERRRAPSRTFVVLTVEGASIRPELVTLP